MMLHPGLLFLLLLLVPLVAWYVWKWKGGDPSVGVSTIAPFKGKRASFKILLMHVCFALQLVAIAGIIVALDISSSMLATDLRPTRLESAKEVATKFVGQRTDDNIGLVVFSGESLSLMPLTSDKAALVNAIKNVESGDLNDGTAIGDGIASAINRLVSGNAKSKSIILLTDGTNNAGDVAPATAAQIAKEKGIKIYTIGAGTNGSIQITDPYGFSTTTMETKIDEAALKNIANITGGKFFRATDSRMLREVFNEIDSLEKTKLNVNTYTQTEDNFMPWLWLSICAYGLFLLLRYTVLRRIP